MEHCNHRDKDTICFINLCVLEQLAWRSFNSGPISLSAVRASSPIWPVLISPFISSARRSFFCARKTQDEQSEKGNVNPGEQLNEMKEEPHITMLGEEIQFSPWNLCCFCLLFFSYVAKLILKIFSQQCQSSLFQPPLIKVSQSNLH